MRRDFRRAEPDEQFVINGVWVTGRDLAEARQQRAHEGSALDRWDELNQHDQDMAALAAGNYLIALDGLVHAAADGDDEMVNVLAVAFETGGSGCEHGEPTCSDCLARIALRTIREGRAV